MKGRLADLLATHAQAGRVAWIGLRATRKAPMTPVPEAEATDRLMGDRARPGKRAVTLIQAEHLPVIGALVGEGPVAPERLRRNIVIAGLNLAALKGQVIALGRARLRLTTVCAPCSRMEEELGPGGYNAMRGHGGWCAEVVTPGRIAVGDAVHVAAP